MKNINNNPIDIRTAPYAALVSRGSEGPPMEGGSLAKKGPI